MDFKINVENINLNMKNNYNTYKMIFIYNSLENGWEVKKLENKYIFTKNIEGKREEYSENSLKSFISKNLSIDN
jgi:hypothetical protein|tara:strand:+ start:1005 stop:1226 length:222 start_codon:yes stop_codon:yes gene_type:complete